LLALINRGGNRFFEDIDVLTNRLPLFRRQAAELFKLFGDDAFFAEIMHTVLV
jgi:hypothetical protein